MNRRRSQSPSGSDRGPDSRYPDSRDSRYSDNRDGRHSRYPESRDSKDSRDIRDTRDNRAAGSSHSHRTSHDQAYRSAGTSAVTSAATASDRERLVSSSGAAHSRPPAPSSLDATASAAMLLSNKASIEKFLDTTQQYYLSRNELRSTSDKVKSTKEWLRRNPSRPDYEEKLQGMLASEDKARKLSSEALDQSATAFTKVIRDHCDVDRKAQSEQLQSALNGNKANHREVLALQKEVRSINESVSSLKKGHDRIEADVGRYRSDQGRDLDKIVATYDRVQALEATTDAHAEKIRKLEKSEARTERWPAESSKPTSKPPSVLVDEEARKELGAQAKWIRTVETRLTKLQEQVNTSTVAPGREARSTTSSTDPRLRRPPPLTLPPPPVPPHPHLPPLPVEQPAPPQETPPPLPPAPREAPPSPSSITPRQALLSATGNAQLQESSANLAGPPRRQADLDESGRIRANRILKRIDGIEERFDAFESHVPERIATEVAALQVDLDSRLEAFIEATVDAKIEEEKILFRKRKRDGLSQRRDDGDDVNGPLRTPTTSATEVPKTGEAAESSTGSEAQTASGLVRPLASAEPNRADSAKAEQPTSASSLTPELMSQLLVKVTEHIQDLTKASIRPAIEQTLADSKTEIQTQLQASTEQQVRQLVSAPDLLEGLATELQKRGVGSTASFEARISAEMEQVKQDNVAFRDIIKGRIQAMEEQQAAVRRVAIKLESQLATQGALLAKFLVELDPFLAHGPTVLDQTLRQIQGLAIPPRANLRNPTQQHQPPHPQSQPQHGPQQQPSQQQYQGSSSHGRSGSGVAHMSPPQVQFAQQQQQQQQQQHFHPQQQQLQQQPPQQQQHQQAQQQQQPLLSPYMLHQLGQMQRMGAPGPTSGSPALSHGSASGVGVATVSSPVLHQSPSLGSQAGHEIHPPYRQ